MSPTPASETPAMAEALAKIEALGKAALEQREQQKSDPRLLWLGSQIDALDPEAYSHGFAGGQEMFSRLASSRHWRRLRAKSLYIVRQQQLYGHRPSVRFWLAKAKEQRRSEKIWAAREGSPLHSVMVSAASIDALIADADEAGRKLDASLGRLKGKSLDEMFQDEVRRIA